MMGSLLKIKHVEILYYQYYITDERFFEVSRTFNHMDNTVEYDIYQQAPFHKIMHDSPEYREIVEAIKKELEK